MSTDGTRDALDRQFVKLCDRRDFDDPRLRSVIRSVVPGLTPGDELERKYWEYAMLAMFLEDVGALREDAELLAVGAGHEAVLFWLANRVGRVVATDIYGAGGFAAEEAEASMLEEPSVFAPYAYREERLDVQWMDARELQFPAGHFDAVFSLSSIEHFGGRRDVARAAAEIGRVVRPGGHAFVVTESFVSRHPLDSPLIQTALRLLTLGRRATTATLRERVVDVFTPQELQRRIIKPSGLRLMQEPVLEVSADTYESVTRWGTHGPVGRRTPHILLQAQGAPWTSICLALQKPS